MEIVKNILVVLHFIGIASLLGGALSQMPAMKSGTAKIVPAIMHGAWTMLATGLLLVGMTYAMGEGEEINNAKIGVKLAVLIAIVVIALVNKKKDAAPKWVIPTISVLTIVNIVIAVFWVTEAH